MPTVLGTHRAPAGKAPLICLHTEQQKLRGSGVIELKQSAYKHVGEKEAGPVIIFELSYTFFSQVKPWRLMKRDSAVTGVSAEPSVPLFCEHGGSGLCICCLTNPVFWRPNR